NPWQPTRASRRRSADHGTTTSRDPGDLSRCGESPVVQGGRGGAVGILWETYQEISNRRIDEAQNQVQLSLAQRLVWLERMVVQQNQVLRALIKHLGQRFGEGLDRDRRVGGQLGRGALERRAHGARAAVPGRPAAVAALAAGRRGRGGVDGGGRRA